MARETFTLNKPLFEDRGAPPPRQRPAAPAGPRPVPLFAGFWIRFLALAFDVMLVVVLHSILAAGGGRDVLFAHAAWAPVLGVFSLLVLFVAIPATVFPGQTLGQKMVRLRVVRADGSPAPASALATRWIVIFSFFIPQWIGAGSPALRDWLTDNAWTVNSLFAIALSVNLSQLILFSLNPLKRGLHDIWARTFVIRLDGPAVTPAQALESLDPSVISRARRMEFMGVVVVPALTVIFLGSMVMSRDPEADARRAALRTRLREAIGPGTDFGMATLPQMATPECYLVQVISPPRLEMPWTDVASSEAYRDLAVRSLDIAEADFDPVALAGEHLAGVPRAGAEFIIGEMYVVVPGVPMLGRPLAGEARWVAWHRQYRDLPMEGARLHGTALIPFTPSSPEATVSPEAIASPEVTASPSSV